MNSYKAFLDIVQALHNCIVIDTVLPQYGVYVPMNEHCTKTPLKGLTSPSCLNFL